MSDNSIMSEAHAQFYKEVLAKMVSSEIPFLVGGGYALNYYCGKVRETVDLDVFCKASDYPRFLSYLQKIGLETEILDSRWLAKVFKGDLFIDFIFNRASNLSPVDDAWFDSIHNGTLFDVDVMFVRPEDLIMNKMYICDRSRFDGADINHLILKCGETLDWKYLMNRSDRHWLLLYSQIINFLFVYPSDANLIPENILNEFINRLSTQMSLPTPKDKVCLGPLISHAEYDIDVREWGYKTVTIFSI